MKNIESQIQQQCVTWFKYQYPKLLLCSFPMGGFRSKITGAILKAEGAVAGSPDLFLFYPTKEFHGLAIEMKTQKGVQSQSQKLWQKIAEYYGYKYVICRSLDEFRSQIDYYIRLT